MKKWALNKDSVVSKPFQSLSTVPRPWTILCKARTKIPYDSSKSAPTGIRSICAARRKRSDTTVGRTWQNRDSVTRAVLSRRKRWRSWIPSRFTTPTSAHRYLKWSNSSVSAKSTDMTCLADQCTTASQKSTRLKLANHLQWRHWNPRLWPRTPSLSRNWPLVGNSFSLRGCDLQASLSSSSLLERVSSLATHLRLIWPLSGAPMRPPLRASRCSIWSFWITRPLTRVQERR